MSYISLSDRDRKKILNILGIEDVKDIYESIIPQKYLLGEELEISSIRDEYELYKYVVSQLQNNEIIQPENIFSGVDLEPVYVPAIVNYLINRGEFLTSYTPYQPEISQGVLQALYEYQSIIAELTGMDVVNSSMYDWGSAAGEALRMSIRVSKINKVLIPKFIFKNRLDVILTYLSGLDTEVIYYKLDENGDIDLSFIEENCKDGCGGLYIEVPNQYGYLNKELNELGEIVHRSGGLYIVGVDVWSLPIIKPPSEYMADIVVGEGQPFGIQMNYGGPLLGIFGVRGDYKLIRQMPGRIIGMTKTVKDNERAFTMILQTREQHIRREKATSNICTNEALTAIQIAIYLSYLGKKGILKTSLRMMKLAHKLNNYLIKLGFKDLFNRPFFRTFTVKSSNYDMSKLYYKLITKGFLPGKFQDNSWILTINSLHNEESIENFVEILRRLVKDEV